MKSSVSEYYRRWSERCPGACPCMECGQGEQPATAGARLVVATTIPTTTSGAVYVSHFVIRLKADLRIRTEYDLMT